MFSWDETSFAVEEGIALPGYRRTGVGAYRGDESCPRITVSSVIPRSNEPELHPVNEMSARAQQKIEDLKVTRHLQAED